MTYDKNISETVSISEVMDYLLDNEEKPSVVLSLIKEFPQQKIEDVFLYSELSERIFFTDFIYKCSFDDAMFIKKIIKNMSNHRVGIYLTWQILQSNLPERIKGIFRPVLQMVATEKHPYGKCRRNSIIMSFDKLFTDASKSIGEIAEDINAISDSTFERICNDMQYSLWANRVYQRDLFLLLNLKKQYMLMKSIMISNTQLGYLNFFRQILNSNVDIEVKRFAYEILIDVDSGIRNILSYKINYWFHLPDDMLKIIDTASCFGEARINLDLYGIDFYVSEFIFYLLCNNKIDWLIDMCESERDIIDRHFMIGDLIDVLRKNRNEL